MIAYLPISPAGDDCDHIRANGMWYQEWQGGYRDILKKGYPQPRQKTTVLAELHSPNIPDFLHGGAGVVPFLVSSRAKKVIRDNKLTGIRFSRVEVTKIATKGKRQRRPRVGEPEEQILNASGQASVSSIPKLHAVYTIGRFEITPKYASGRCPHTGYVTPYDLPSIRTMPDLWCPTINGRMFSAWIYCSERFVAEVERANLSNISFVTFEAHMSEVRANIENRIDSHG